MLAIVLAIAIAILILMITLLAWLVPRAYKSLKTFHRRLVGLSMLGYGIYLAILTGTATQLVLPGIEGIGVGAVAGAGAGYATYRALGVVGAVTGGVDIAIGPAAMTLIGAVLGAVGSVAGNAGFQAVTDPYVDSVIWTPFLFFSIYIFFGIRKQKRIRRELKILENKKAAEQTLPLTQVELTGRSI